MPPPWITYYDRRPFWAPKKSTSMEYVFCYGNLSFFNIMFQERTLEVLALFDWEHTGYFPPQF